MCMYVCGCVVYRGGIVIDINSGGKRTGAALVVLETSEHAEMATKRHRFFLECRYIEVRVLSVYMVCACFCIHV